MIPAHPDITLFVEAGAKACLHVVGNKATARSHERTVSEFSSVFFVPENNFGKTKNLVIKKIYSTDKRAYIEKKHYRALYAKICYDRWKWEACKGSANATNIEILQKSFESSEFNLAAMNDFFWRCFDFSSIQNILW